MSTSARVALAASLFASLSAPLVAQAPLVVKTTFEDLAYHLLEGLGSEADLPRLEAGMVWQITLDDGGAASVQAVQGSVGLAEVEARPAQLMTIFSAQVGQARSMAQGFGAMGLGQAGIKTAEAVKIISSVFDFPKQIALARVIVDGDPDHPAQGWDVSLTLTPADDTWLAGLMKAMKPSGMGAPVIGNDGAAMRFQFDADWAALSEPFGVFNELMASMGSKSEEDAERRLPMMQKYWHTIGAGGAAMNWDLGGGGMAFAISLADPDAMKALYAAPEFLAWTKDMQQMAPGQEAEVTPNAFTHRGVNMLKSVVTTENEHMAAQNPLMKDGKMVGYNAIAGNYLVSSVGGSDSDVKALVDLILDGKLKNQMLPVNTLAVMHVNLPEFIDVMSQGRAPANEIPESVRVDITNVSGNLGIRVVVR